MCKIIEDMRKEEREEGRQEGMLETALRMLEDGSLTIEKIAQFTGMPVEEVKKLQMEKFS